jgi:hypothetical protein
MKEHIEPASVMLQNLAVLCLLVIKKCVHVDGLVELADVGVDADLPEKRFHSERTRLVRNNRHNQLADFRIAQQL